MKELTSPTVPLAAFPEEYRQFESTRVLYGPRIRRCLVVHVSLLRPHHSLEPPAGRADRTERSPSHLVSHSVLLPDFPNSSLRVPLRSVQRMGIAVLAWSMVLMLLTTSLASLWLFLQPTHSRSSTPVCPNQPSLLPFCLTSRPDFKGRFLSPATFDSADEDVTTEVYTIPIALVNHTLYDLG